MKHIKTPIRAVVHATPNLSTAFMFDADWREIKILPDTASDIIRAVNNYDKLLAACKAVAGGCCVWNPGGSGEFIAPPQKATLDLLAKAIAEAEKGTV